MQLFKENCVLSYATYVFRTKTCKYKNVYKKMSILIKKVRHELALIQAGKTFVHLHLYILKL